MILAVLDTAVLDTAVLDTAVLDTAVLRAGLDLGSVGSEIQFDVQSSRPCDAGGFVGSLSEVYTVLPFLSVRIIPSCGFWTAISDAGGA